MASSPEIMLEEMRHAYDTVHASVKKYANKTFMMFGAELTLLLFYLADNELGKLKQLFAHPETGWYLFAIFAVFAFMASAVLFIITLAVGDRPFSIPPDEFKLLQKGEYKEIAPDELEVELIEEYHRDIKHFAKKVHIMKLLSNAGMYFLAAGIVLLLLIKFFGV